MGRFWNLKMFTLRLNHFLCRCLLLQTVDLFQSLNSEGVALLKFRERVEKDPHGALSNWNGDGGDDPCSWFGVGCLDGEVVILNLHDLSLEGTLSPDLGKLNHIKYLILHNNSFSGIIPKEIGEMKELEVLDVAHNNFSGPLPSELESSSSLEVLCLSNNRFLSNISPELYELSTRSEFLIDENMLSDAAQEAFSNRRFITRNINQVEDVGNRRLLQDADVSGPSNGRHDTKPVPSPPTPLLPSPTNSSLAPASAPAPTDVPPSHSLAGPTNTNATPPSASGSVPSPPANAPLPSKASSAGHTLLWKMAVALGAACLLSVSVAGIVFCQKNKVVTVRPWATGLSGQLQKAFITGVPSLKRPEVEAACEGFSNVIGSSVDSMVYKGTLSSGVEIAVASTTAKSVKDWSKHSETQFRKKIDALSKVNHKNFVNLLGYCKEEEPFTRMMVFEYAPNGTLFEHLHVKEAEHLDWPARLRIAMGIAYCLDYMHQLNPPVVQRSLHSKTIYLAEDYAAKVSDFAFWNDNAAAKKVSDDAELLNMLGRESNVYCFGIILLEMLSGKLPYSDYEGPLIHWLFVYLGNVRPIREMIDPTLNNFQEVEATALCDLIVLCTDADPKKRPSMREVTNRLREITGISPDEATPKLSPLWWAELEILSTSDGS